MNLDVESGRYTLRAGTAGLILKLIEVEVKRATNTWQAAGWALQHIGSDDIRHSLGISIWVRWFVGAAWFAQENYLMEFSSETYVPHSILAATLMALNGYVYYRIRSGRPVSWHWALGLSMLDLATITAALGISGGFSNDFYVLYYPALAAFAVVFASFRLSFTCVTITAAFYTVVSLHSGLDFESGQEKVLFIRIVTMYAVVMAVSLIFRLERSRRREAVQRERELQRERIELSQTIHDTIAQTAYMMGIGVETAIELAEGTSEELVAKLKATHALSKSTMWELRHPIDAGPIFEGRDLGRVLRSHASTFTTITSIPADVVQRGDEPQFSTVTKGL